MIHTFKMHGINIVVDVNSSAVHVVSDVVFDILNNIDTAGKYSKNDVDDAIDEIARLKDLNMLYTDHYITNMPDKQPVVKALCLHISHDCNLRCEYCFAGTGNFSGERCSMSEDVGKKAIDFVIQSSANRNNIEIDFFGGEPLMNFNVVKSVTKYAREQGEKYGKVFRLTLTTNGVLLDDEKLKFINENMSNIVLSIDGRKEINDSMRKSVSGDGSYDIIMPRFIKTAESRNQDNYYIRGTFTKHNLDFASDVLHLADIGFKQISVEPVVGGRDKAYSLSEDDLPALFEQYEMLAKEYAERYNTDDWFNFFHFNIDLQQGPCVIKRVVGCGAGSEYLAITPDGDIYPCHQFVGNENFLMGNVLRNEYNSSVEFSNANIYTKSKCTECWAKFYCSGGCHANAYQFSGDIFEPYQIGCELEKKRIECALYIAAKGKACL